MAHGVSNLSNISNNDLVLLRKVAKKHTRIYVMTGTKKFLGMQSFYKVKKQAASPFFSSGLFLGV